MTPTTSSLTIRRLIKAPVTRVFLAWTTPEEIARWIGPGTWKTSSTSIDLRVGGEYRIRMEHAGQQIEMCGAYQKIEPPHRLIFTWRLEGDPEMSFGDTQVTVDLVDVDGATEVCVTHEGFGNDALREQHDEGWQECLDEMERLTAADPHREQATVFLDRQEHE